MYSLGEDGCSLAPLNFGQTISKPTVTIFTHCSQWIRRSKNRCILSKRNVYRCTISISNSPMTYFQVLVILADDGPDFSLASELTLHNFGRLWRDLELQMFVMVKYCPGMSRLNPGIHFWEILSPFLILYIDISFSKFSF